MANYHVSGNRKYGYNVSKENASRISGHYDTKAEAESQAKSFSHNSGGGEVRIHGTDGKIQDSDTVKPGQDSHPPIDTKH
ncbi:MAG: DUF2188 domain-containing protein [Microgenomates group bacterium]